MSGTEVGGGGCDRMTSLLIEGGYRSTSGLVASADLIDYIVPKADL